MNIELLPEGETKERISEDIITELQISSTGTPEKSKKILSAVIILSCFMLCAVSLALHAAAVGEVIGSFWGRGRELLVSAVIPGVEVHLPALPSEKEQAPKKDGEDKDEREAGDSAPIAEYMSADLSSGADSALDISNETSYKPDIGELYSGARPVSAIPKSTAGNDPLVLIYHTHGTEAYAESAASSFRSSDISKNVVAVGTTVTDVLGELGITAIHLEEMFDSENWSAAYDTSTVAVRAALKKHPTVKYIFDVHRDCIGNDEAGYIRSLSSYENIETAQLMFVCGTNQGGSGHDTWQQNLAFALQLQGKLWDVSKTLMRPIDLRCASFYQDTGNGALLAEFGTCANTLTEAKRSAVLFAASLAEYIYGESCDIDRTGLINKYCG